MSEQHQLILCIVNAGFTELVMDAAKAAGAKGGTVLNAKGTANKEAEAFFHITIQPEKELVMILVDADIRDDVLHALYQHAGIDTPGQGIAFALPVDEVVGLGQSAPAATSQEASEDKPKEEGNETAQSDLDKDKPDQQKKPKRKLFGRK